MKTKIKYIAFAILAISVFFNRAEAQQNIQLTQYIFNSLSVSPAYAGYKEEWFAQLALRDQWSGIKGAPRTGQLSIDGILDPVNLRHGAGLQLTADKLGPQSATSAYLNYAFRLQLDEMMTKRLSFGLGVGVTQYSLDGTMIETVESGDNALINAKESDIVPDIRFGVFYSSPKFYLGASIMDLLSNGTTDGLFNQEDNPFTIARKRHLYVMTGTLINIDKGMRLRPSLLIKEDFKGPTSLDLNAMLIFADRFWVGAGYRTNLKLWSKDFEKGQEFLARKNSFSGIAQFYVTDRFRIGYSYDYILSQLSSVQNGSHEITIGLTFPQKGQRVISPRFF